MADEGGSTTDGASGGPDAKSTAPDGGGDAGRDGGGGNKGDGGGDASDASGPFSTSFQFAVGEEHACALFPDGRAKCWGQLYVGAFTHFAGNAPNTMGASLAYLDFGGANVARIAAGSQKSCGILESGQVRCFGNSVYGELGSAGGVYLNGASQNLPLPAGRTVREVALGWTHTCLLFDDGTVRCIGANDAGQLGQGDTTPRTSLVAIPAVALGAGRSAKHITANGTFTCATLDDDRLKCWGANSNLQGGSGGIGGNLCTGDHIARGDQPGTMGDALPYAALGNDGMGQPWHVKKVTTGPNYACAILANDRLKCWGRNDGGYLGSGNTTTYGETPALIGDAIPFIVVGTTAGSPTPVVDVAAAAFATCAVLQGGAVKCWGGHALGVLGDEQSTNVIVGDDPAEMGDSLALVPLGAGRVATAIGSNANTMCALFTGGAIKCWGANGYGQLGQGDNVVRGNMQNQMGDNLLPVVLQ